MATRPRRNHTPAFKAKAALAAVRGERTLVELAQQFDERPHQITQWRNQLLDGAAGVFDGEAKTIAPAPAVDVKTLHAKIGGSDAGERFFVRRAREGRASERKAMIDRQHDPPLSRQAKVLGISRVSVYYPPRAVPAADLALMRRIDALHLEYPFAGSRMLQDLVNAECHVAGRACTSPR